MEHEAVDKITTKALQDHIDGVNWKEKPYFDLEAYTEREDGAGLYPEFDLGTSGSEYQAVLLTDGPIRKNYVEGDYLTLSGLNVWQDVGSMWRKVPSTRISRSRRAQI